MTSPQTPATPDLQAQAVADEAAERAAFHAWFAGPDDATVRTDDMRSDWQCAAFIGWLGRAALAARPAEPAPVVEAAGARAVIEALVKRIERNECQHESTHRGGAIWTICDDCNQKWADDQGGGFKRYKRPTELLAADEWLADQALPAAAPVAEKCDGKNASTCRNQIDCEIAGRCLDAQVAQAAAVAPAQAAVGAANLLELVHALADAGRTGRGGLHDDLVNEAEEKLRAALTQPPSEADRSHEGGDVTDTERLDWLEAHPDLVAYSRSMGCWKMPGAFEASTAREAIDTVREDSARATGDAQ